jgi:hypothetical protein
MRRTVHYLIMAQPVTSDKLRSRETLHALHYATQLPQHSLTTMAVPALH